MSRKHVLKPYKVVNAGGMSGNITSSPTNVSQLDKVDYSIEWAGAAPVGQITVERSLDGTSWKTLDISPTIDVSGNTGSHIIHLFKGSIEWLRVVYTKTSGTGSMDIHINGNTIGA